MLEAQEAWAASVFAGDYADARSQLTLFNEYKAGSKRRWVQERTDLGALLGNIQTKLKTYHLREWTPSQGLHQADIDAAWVALAQAEAAQSRRINAEIRNAKEALRIRFAELANGFEARLREISKSIVSLSGELEDQLDRIKKLQAELEAMRTEFLQHLQLTDRACRDANVEENDHTVHTLDDLLFELELVTTSVVKKVAFIENQVSILKAIIGNAS